MGELIPHSYLLIEEMIRSLKEEYKKANKLPFMHRAEYESLVLDTIRRDASDVEDPNDVIDVTKFLHERGKDYSLYHRPSLVCHAKFFVRGELTKVFVMITR